MKWFLAAFLKRKISIIIDLKIWGADIFISIFFTTLLRFITKKIYIRLVISQKYTVVNKITAILLMALMLFINAVKLFHTHPALTESAVFAKKVSSHHSGDILPQRDIQNDHCAICDFQLTKDAEVPTTTVALIPLFHQDTFCIPKLLSFISAFHSTSSGRAPPFLS